MADYTEADLINYQERDNKFSTSEKIEALANQSITGFRATLDGSLEKHIFGFEKMPGYQALNDENVERLMTTGVTDFNSINMLSDVESPDEFEFMLQERNKNLKDMNVINDMSAYVAMPSMFALGMLDPASWIAGAGIGKLAISAGNILNVTSKAGKFAQFTGAAITTGYVSEKMLQETTGTQDEQALLIASVSGMAISGIYMGAKNGFSKMLSPESFDALKTGYMGNVPKGAEVPRTWSNKLATYMRLDEGKKLELSKDADVRELHESLTNPLTPVKNAEGIIPVQRVDTAVDIKDEVSDIFDRYTYDMDQIQANKDGNEPLIGRDVILNQLADLEFDEIQVRNNKNRAIQGRLNDEEVQFEMDLEANFQKEIQDVKLERDSLTDHIRTVETEVAEIGGDASITKAMNENLRELQYKVTALEKQRTPGRVSRDINAIDDEMIKVESSYQKMIDDPEIEISKIDEDNIRQELIVLKAKRDSLKEEFLVRKTEQGEVIKEHRTERQIELEKQRDIDMAEARQKVFDDIPEGKQKDLLKRTVEYFKEYCKRSKASGHSTFTHVDCGLYVPHRYDGLTVSKNQVGAAAAFEKALLRNFKGKEVNVEILAQVRQTSKNIVEKIANNVSFRDTLDIEQTALRELSINMTSGYGLAPRKLTLNLNDLGDFVKRDIVEIASDYNFKMSGKIALKETVGIDKDFGFDELMAQHNVTDKEKNAFRHIITSIDGTREIDPYSDNWFSTSIRFMNNMNFANFGGFFGVNTLTDIGISVAKNGVRTLKYVMPEFMDAIRTGSKNPEFVKQMSYLNIGIEHITNGRQALFTNPHLSQKMGYMEKGSHMLAQSMAKYSGLNMITDALDHMTALTFMEKAMIHGANPTKMSKTMINDFHKVGLTLNDISEFAKSGAVEMKGGMINKDTIKLHQMRDVPVIAKFRRALNKNIKQTIIKNDPINLPSWMISWGDNHSAPRAMFQFLKFPVMAHNVVTSHLMNNPKLVDITVGSATAIFINLLATQLKDVGKEDKQFDLETDEGMQKSLSYVGERFPLLAIGGLFHQYAGGIYDDSQWNQGMFERVGGVTANRTANVYDLMTNAAKGDLQSRDRRTVESFVPFISYPILGNLFREMVRE